jgi:hypothetical protein
VTSAEKPAAKPKSTFGGLKLTVPAKGVAALATPKLGGVSTSPAAAPAGSGFAGVGKTTGAGGFAALSTKGGGFKKAEPGASMFNKPAAPMFGGKTKASPTKADGSPTKAGTASAGGDEDGGSGAGDGISGDDGIHFDAIIKLTKVETMTGEEGWEELLKFPCKLWRWGETNSGQAWKERGKGEMKMQRNGNTRLLMRRPETKKLCCNQVISPQATLTHFKDQETYLTWSSLDGSGDETTDPTKPYLFLMKLKDAATADQFKKLYETGQKEYTAGAVPSAPAVDKSTAASGAAVTGAGGATSGFKKKTTTDWRCETCFIEVSLDKTKCGACGTMKPGCAPSADEAKKVAPKSSFSFGGQAKASAPTSAGASSDKAAPTSRFAQPKAGGTAAAPPTSKFTPSGGGAGAATAPKGGALSFSFGKKSTPPASAVSAASVAAPQSLPATAPVPKSSFGQKVSPSKDAAATNLGGGGTRFGAKSGAPTISTDAATAKPKSAAGLFGHTKASPARGTAVPDKVTTPTASPVKASPTKAQQSTSMAAAAGGATPQKLNFSFGKGMSFAKQPGVSPTKPTDSPAKLSFAFGKPAAKFAAPPTSVGTAGGGGDDGGGDDVGGDDNDSDTDDDDDDGNVSLPFDNPALLFFRTISPTP